MPQRHQTKLTSLIDGDAKAIPNTSNKFDEFGWWWHIGSVRLWCVKFVDGIQWHLLISQTPSFNHVYDLT